MSSLYTMTYRTHGLQSEGRQQQFKWMQIFYSLDNYLIKWHTVDIFIPHIPSCALLFRIKRQRFFCLQRWSTFAMKMLMKCSIYKSEADRKITVLYENLTMQTQANERSWNKKQKRTQFPFSNLKICKYSQHGHIFSSMFRLLYIILLGTEKHLHIFINNNKVNKKCSGIYSKDILLHCCIVIIKMNQYINMD